MLFFRYLDTHDITALLLALHKMYAAVFNYETPVKISKDDIEDKAMALLGMDWGPSKVDQLRLFFFLFVVCCFWWYLSIEISFCFWCLFCLFD